VHAPAGGIYYAGDTGYCAHFRDIRERLGSPRVALLPIGAFEPRWFMSPVHMDPAQAVQAHLDLGAVTSVAVHYGSFALADDEQGQPERELTAALREQRVADARFRMLPHGVAVGLPRGVAELGADAVA
jgi:L-ascorbate metabolism protein UlaG (beta-lactamase superfamily)